MKTYLIAAATLGLALALPFNASSQARHDEKPHASTKPAATSTEPRIAATGGRHDSGTTTHGMRRRAVAKDPASTDDSGKEKESR